MPWLVQTNSEAKRCLQLNPPLSSRSSSGGDQFNFVHKGCGGSCTSGVSFQHFLRLFCLKEEKEFIDMCLLHFVAGRFQRFKCTCADFIQKQVLTTGYRQKSLVWGDTVMTALLRFSSICFCYSTLY